MCMPWLTKMRSSHVLISTVRGCNVPSQTALRDVERKEESMFAIVVLILLLVFLALAGANLLVENINSDELSSMGVEKRS